MSSRRNNTFFSELPTKSEIEHQRYLSNFRHQDFIEPDIIINDAVKDYNYIPGKNIEKSCVLIKGSLLRELFNEVKYNVDNNFESYINDFILNSSEEEFNKQYVSADGKIAKHNDPELIRSEIIYSRLSSIFGVKTAFVIPLSKDLLNMARVDVKPRNYITNDSNKKYPQTIKTFNDLVGTEIGTSAEIKTWLKSFDIFLEKNADDCNLSSETIKKIKADFIKSFIIRKFIFKDNDFHGNNIAFSYSNNYSDLKISPAFDFEYCYNYKLLSKEETPEEKEEYLNNNISYIVREYPEITSYLMSDLKSIADTKEDQIDAIFRRFSKNENHAYFGKAIILSNIKTVVDCYYNIKNLNNESELV